LIAVHPSPAGPDCGRPAGIPQVHRFVGSHLHRSLPFRLLDGPLHLDPFPHVPLELVYLQLRARNLVLVAVVRLEDALGSDDPGQGRLSGRYLPGFGRATFGCGCDVLAVPDGMAFCVLAGAATKTGIIRGLRVAVHPLFAGYECIGKRPLSGIALLFGKGALNSDSHEQDGQG